MEGRLLRPFAVGGVGVGGASVWEGRRRGHEGGGRHTHAQPLSVLRTLLLEAVEGRLPEHNA